jgi:hypothetical protein
MVYKFLVFFQVEHQRVGRRVSEYDFFPGYAASNSNANFKRGQVVTKCRLLGRRNLYSQDAGTKSKHQMQRLPN